MADASQTPSNPPTDDMHWGIAYLREDIQDLRQDVRGLHGRIDGTSESLSRRIEEVNESLSRRIDEVNESLHRRIDAVADALTRRIDSRFALLLMAMIGLHGLTVGAIIAFLQLSLPS